MTTTRLSGEEPAVSEPKPRRPRGGRRRVVLAGLAVAAVAVASLVVLSPFEDDAKEPAIGSGSRTGLAKVTQGTLAARTMENGTLGYAGSFQVINKRSGTATRLPSVGQTIGQGKVLYRVDGKPVIFLRGSYVPVYRALAWGNEGADVRQLNAALVDLGYATEDELDPESDYFGRQTYLALLELQDEVGLTESGELELGQAVFLPAEEVRVTKVSAVLGGSVSSGGTVLQASSTERQVSVALSASQQADVKSGDEVTITLPTGKSTPGEVTSVGKVATKGSNDTTIDVLIRPLKPKETGRLDKAPVQVAIVTETAKDVLSVPVNALLALAGGGYAVEVVDAAGAHRLVGVETGLFDNSAGTVQVTGQGLAVGQNIVVPA